LLGRTLKGKVGWEGKKPLSRSLQCLGWHEPQAVECRNGRDSEGYVGVLKSSSRNMDWSAQAAAQKNLGLGRCAEVGQHSASGRITTATNETSCPGSASVRDCHRRVFSFVLRGYS